MVLYMDKDGNVVEFFVFGLVVEVMKEIGVDVLIVFVFGVFMKDVMIEVIDVEILLFVVIIEGVFVGDLVEVWVYV